MSEEGRREGGEGKAEEVSGEGRREGGRGGGE